MKESTTVGTNSDSKSFIALADGTVFEGTTVGTSGHVCGELVFNTSHTGYQEILTDPSYAGQMVLFACPHIGNAGVNSDDYESDSVWAKGAIFRAFSEVASNWRSEGGFKDFLSANNVVALSDVDTRALTHHLRIHGSHNACIVSDGSLTVAQALELAKATPSLANQNLTALVSTLSAYNYRANKPSNALYVVVLDYGIKTSILRTLADVGANLTIVPASTSASEVLALKPDGIVLSNGPGDPAACTDIIANIQQLLQYCIPIFGICLGHQLLALACGGKTRKMAFGHHGANHPVRELKTSAVFISSQNHNFVVDESAFPSCLEITHRSLFDGTIAGIRHRTKRAFSFQGHPEAGPGPTELKVLFEIFMEEVKNATMQRH